MHPGLRNLADELHATFSRLLAYLGALAILSVAAAELFKAPAAGGVHQCLGFVRAFEDPRLQIAGWSCKPERDIVDRGIIACALDRLTLLAAGSDPRTGELFAVAERDRTFCGQHDPLLA